MTKQEKLKLLKKSVSELSKNELDELNQYLLDCLKCNGGSGQNDRFETVVDFLSSLKKYSQFKKYMKKLCNKFKNLVKNKK
jgi:hypothetical protein